MTDGKYHEKQVNVLPRQTKIYFLKEVTVKRDTYRSIVCASTVAFPRILKLKDDSLWAHVCDCVQLDLIVYSVLRKPAMFLLIKFLNSHFQSNLWHWLLKAEVSYGIVLGWFKLCLQAWPHLHFLAGLPLHHVAWFFKFTIIIFYVFP